MLLVADPSLAHTDADFFDEEEQALLEQMRNW